MRILPAAITVLVLATSGASAETGGAAPSELPPEDFGGRQYVDSTGCVFVRAEVGGTVAWAPRLTSTREHVCGFPPTFPADAVAEARPEIRPEVVPVNAKPVAAVMRPAKTAAARPPVAATKNATARGFRSVWDDGRLNPDRGPRTARGDEMMRRIWTDEVPMRLVEP